MTRKTWLTLAIGTLLAVAGAGAHAQRKDCRIEPFSGAGSTLGAEAKMTVRNTGAPCRIPTFGIASERKHPAESGTITQQPAHGTATFEAPAAVYVPASGFAGEDTFAYEARARGFIDTQVILKVRVKVTVIAP